MHHSLPDQALAGWGQTERHLRLEELAGLQCNRPKIGNTISLPKACYNNTLREFVKLSQGRDSQVQISAKKAVFTDLYRIFGGKVDERHRGIIRVCWRGVELSYGPSSSHTTWQLAPTNVGGLCCWLLRRA